MESITVEIGTVVVTDEPTRLVMQGLGSCLGIFLYEDRKKIAAAAHVLLPSGPEKKMKERPGKYVESALRYMLEEIERRGGERRHVRAKMAGGAHMFRFDSREEHMAIGEQNIHAAHEALAAHNIELAAHDTGGRQGRSLVVDTASGMIGVHTIRGPVTML
jgi:chemotaxis protein CheD